MKNQSQLKSHFIRNLALLYLFISITKVNSQTTTCMLSNCQQTYNNQEKQIQSGINANQTHYRYEANLYKLVNSNYVFVASKIFSDAQNGTITFMQMIHDWNQNNTPVDINYTDIYAVKLRVKPTSNDSFTLEGPACHFKFKSLTRFHNNDCTGALSFLASMTLNNASPYANSYLAKFFTDCSSSTPIAQTTLAAGNNQTFLDFSLQNGGVLDFGNSYCVKYYVQHIPGGNWYESEETCSISFDNKVKLHPNRCGNLQQSMNQTIHASPAGNFAMYRINIYATNGYTENISNPIGTPLEFNFNGSYPQFNTYPNITCNTEYLVRYQVKVTSTSDWSNEGPACSTMFTFSANAGLDLTTCSGNNSNLGGTPVAVGSATHSPTYTWTGPNSFVSNVANPSVSSLALGTYVVNIANSYGCTASDSVNVLSSIIYVNAANTSTLQNGMSWSTAFSDLQDALAIATNGNNIWVAQGTYYPTNYVNANSRLTRLIVPSGVNLYGGFDGTEPCNFNLNNRDIQGHQTILSGDIDQDNNNTNNSYTILLIEGSSFTIVDGFTVENGNGNYNVVNAVYRRGAGIRVINSTAKIQNCIVRNNHAISAGAGIYNQCSFVEVVNTLVVGNSCDHEAGGFHQLKTNSTVTPSSTLTNCTFVNNDGADYNAISRESDAGSITIKNSIIWDNGSGNSTNASSALNTIYDGNNLSGTSNSNPNLNSSTYELTSSSTAAIDAGSNAFNNLSIDLNSNARIMNSTIDLGAFEWQSGNRTALTTGIADKTTVLKLKVYPNPSNDIFYVESKNNQNAEIYNSLGQMVKSVQIEANSINQFDMKEMPNGIYILKLNNSTESITLIKN